MLETKTAYIRTSIFIINFTAVFFFRFVDKENVGSVNQLKSSAQRGMKTKIIAQFPHVEGIWDEVVPKKSGLKLVKW